VLHTYLEFSPRRFATGLVPRGKLTEFGIIFSGTSIGNRRPQGKGQVSYVVPEVQIYLPSGTYVLGPVSLVQYVQVCIYIDRHL
jgi:hypothetical protein